MLLCAVADDEGDVANRDVEAVLIECDQCHVVPRDGRDLARRDNIDQRRNDLHLFAGQFVLGQSGRERRCSSRSPSAGRMSLASDPHSDWPSEVDIRRAVDGGDGREVTRRMVDCAGNGVTECGDGHKVAPRHRVERYCSKAACTCRELRCVMLGFLRIATKFTLQIAGDVGFLHGGLPTSGKQHYLGDRMAGSLGGNGT